MREILFRGKRKTNNEWVYGNYCGAEYLINEGIEHFIIEIPRNGSSAKVIPETVGQYTGLTDKNGTKIFEGDILKEVYEVFVSAREKEKRTRIGYVEYSACSLCNGYYAYFWNDKEKWRGNFAIHCGCEVIGNIHDNPELLKENDNA